jgi:CheY-like chemotaxis protein
VAKAKVLVVDDDSIVSFAVGEILTGRGFDVVLAESVPTALKLITSEPFDVLVSDLHMPGAGDGLPPSFAETDRASCVRWRGGQGLSRRRAAGRNPGIG